MQNSSVNKDEIGTCIQIFWLHTIFAFLYVSGDLGCSINALPFLDIACSGKNECQYISPQPDLYDARCTQDAAADSSLYLQTDYTCIEGTTSKEFTLNCVHKKYLKFKC